jgi:hypothetical protein
MAFQDYGLPALPTTTTTTGSFPQTPEIRAARAGYVAGRVTRDDYEAAMRAEVDRVIALQEEIGLDVLVHGEPERAQLHRSPVGRNPRLRAEGLRPFPWRYQHRVQVLGHHHLRVGKVSYGFQSIGFRYIGFRYKVAPCRSEMSGSRAAAAGRLSSGDAWPGRGSKAGVHPEVLGRWMKATLRSVSSSCWP